MSKDKHLLTQSLISSWQYCLSSGNMDEFITTLKRIKTPQNEAMLNGIKFESMVQAACEGNLPRIDHEWYSVIVDTAEIVKGSAYQVKLDREIEVDGMRFVVYGIADFVKCGTILDTKFSAKYGSNGDVNKYFDSPQSPFYFYCLPEAKEFIYVISDGKYVYREHYTPEEVPTAEQVIRPFMRWLDKLKLMDVYKDKWKSSY